MAILTSWLGKCALKSIEKRPDLQLLRHKGMNKLRSWPIHEFLHMKKEWNQSADRLASKALQQEQVTIALSDLDRQDLSLLNRLNELLTPKNVNQVVKIAVVTRSAVRRLRSAEVLQEEFVQKVRIRESIKHRERRVGSTTWRNSWSGT